MPSRKAYRKNSDIPYAIRLRLQKEAEIQENRDTCASRMLYAMMEALHDLYGIGFQRMVSWQRRTMELIHIFYADREVEQEHLRQRLATLGFRFEDFPMVTILKPTRSAEITANGEDAALVAMLVALVSANDILGLGADRLQRLSEATHAIMADCQDPERYQQHIKKMEVVGFSFRDGRVLVIIDADGNPVKRKNFEI